MDTPDEIARDEWYSDLVDEISQQAIDDFTLDRLRSYYIAHPSLATDAFAMYNESLKALEVSKSAALVLATTAIEVGLKVTLLKPVVYGLVHNESVADLISDLAVKHNGLDRFKPLLARVVKEYGGIDFATFKMDDHHKTIWEEIDALQKARNAVVHQARMADLETVTLALQVGGFVLGKFLTSVLEGLGLQLNNKMIIVNS
jgi:hypothetical protein